jgi:hypothetical protein
LKPTRIVLACVAVLLAVSVASAQAEKPKAPPIDLKQPPPPIDLKQPAPPLQPLQPPFFGPADDLIPAASFEKLMLTKEQKADYDKINEEFRKKVKDLFAPPTPDTDPRKFMQSMEARMKLRPDYLAKVEKLLTDDQKKTFAQLPRFGPGTFAPPIFMPPMNPFGPQVGAAFLPLDAQQRLKLTDDQKKKVADLQKELETKILEVLTAEQKKAFEDMKKRGTGFPNLTVPTLPVPPNPPALPLDLPKQPPAPPGVEKKADPLVPAPADPTRPPELKKRDR